ncbi:putative E3 ubiquitin ligase [Handroanthus impetiginosus]|uniref:E3 ubiquitin-protein ligase RMA n=1 Tax=Handroanthus impetiginosus TaxID=429701 RepID=A0A2G9I6C0_9LAMI|nr:putative E3 ubiquitin ligase [Handroanthus impetiginosus]
MDDDNLMDVNFTELDLNQEPTDPLLPSVERVGSLLNELETAHDRIEERIRQLEGVTARARQRQRWRQERNSMVINHFSGAMIVNLDGQEDILDGINNMGVAERTVEKRKGYKRDSSHLVAKALAKADKERGSFYDCNICLEVAREPVLTCCGHLFCWACFYRVANVDPTSKECPVCKGEVSDSAIIPVYCNGDSEPVYETELGLKIPPRPKARRVESVRQQRVTRGLSQVSVAEPLRRIRISIGTVGNQTQQEEGGSGILNFDMESQEGQNVEAAGSHRIRIHQVSRVLSESAASLSSLSSALSNAERLVEDLEIVISNRFSRNDAQASSVDVGNPPTTDSAVLQSNNQPSDSTADLNAALPITSSSQSTNVSSSAVDTPTMTTSTEITLPIAPSYSLRRRRIVSRTSDVRSRDTRQSRRTRLN